jgi:hypothetical protein
MGGMAPPGAAVSPPLEQARGVAFTMKPTAMGPLKIAILADTCGNLIQLYKPTP